MFVSNLDERGKWMGIHLQICYLDMNECTIKGKKDGV